MFSQFLLYYAKGNLLARISYMLRSCTNTVIGISLGCIVKQEGKHKGETGSRTLNIALNGGLA